MYNPNRPAIAVGTITVHGEVTSAYVDGVGAEVVGAYDLCKKNLTLRGKIQAQVLTKAVKALNAYGKAEIVNGDRLMFVADLAKVGTEQGKVKDFVLKTLADLAKEAGIEVEFDAAEAVSWINYVPEDDGSYTLASAYGNAWFMINGDLASQRKTRREAMLSANQSQDAPKAHENGTIVNKVTTAETGATDKLVDTILPNAK